MAIRFRNTFQRKLLLTSLTILVTLTVTGWGCSAGLKDRYAECDTYVVNGTHIKTGPNNYGVGLVAGNDARESLNQCKVRSNVRHRYEATLLAKSNPGAGTEATRHRVIFGFDQRIRPSNAPCRWDRSWGIGTYMRLHAFCKFNNPGGTVFQGQVRYEGRRWNGDLVRKTVILGTSTEVFQ